MENTAKNAVVPQYSDKVEINFLANLIDSSIAVSSDHCDPVRETIKVLRGLNLLRTDRIDFGPEPGDA